jgi:hypothetical protein
MLKEVRIPKTLITSIALMRNFYFASRKVITLGCKLIVAFMLLLSKSRAFARTAFPARLTPNLPLQISPRAAVRNKPPAAVPGTAVDYRPDAQAEPGKAGFTCTCYVFDELGKHRYALPP